MYHYTQKMCSATYKSHFCTERTMKLGVQTLVFGAPKGIWCRMVLLYCIVVSKITAFMLTCEYLVSCRSK